MNEPKRELCNLIDHAVESVLGPTEDARKVGYAVARLFDEVEDRWDEIRYLKDADGEWEDLNQRSLTMSVHREAMAGRAVTTPHRTAGMGG